MPGSKRDTESAVQRQIAPSHPKKGINPPLRPKIISISYHNFIKKSSKSFQAISVVSSRFLRTFFTAFSRHGHFHNKLCFFDRNSKFDLPCIVEFLWYFSAFLVILTYFIAPLFQGPFFV